MSANYNLPLREYKSAVREIVIDGVKIGGENALPFMNTEMNLLSKPCIAVEILSDISHNFPETLKNAWGEVVNDTVKWAIKASKIADMLCVRFNIQETKDIKTEINKSVETAKNIAENITIPIIFIGALQPEIDRVLLPEIARAVKKPCITGIIEEDTYKEVIPSLIENNHYVIARTPIDINLAKELNILITETGFSADRILVDPNMGALGYGLDYGYSIIERVKLAGLGDDNMLNMPVVTFVGEESWKSKEAKSKAFLPEWGELNNRSIIWECVTASAVISAGANIIVMRHPEAVENIKKFINR